MSTIAQEGWICPKCNRVNAPWLPNCQCHQSVTTYQGSYPAQIQFAAKPLRLKRLTPRRAKP